MLGWFLCSLIDLLSFSVQSSQVLLSFPPAEIRDQTATEGQNGSRLLQICVLVSHLSFLIAPREEESTSLACINTRQFCSRCDLSCTGECHCSHLGVKPSGLDQMCRRYLGLKDIIRHKADSMWTIIQIPSPVKVDNCGWQRCGTPSPRDWCSLDMIQLCSGSSRAQTVAWCSR